MKFKEEMKVGAAISFESFQQLEHYVKLLEDRIASLEAGRDKYDVSPIEFAAECRKRLERLGSEWRVWPMNVNAQQLANGKWPIWRVTKADTNNFIVAKLTTTVGWKKSKTDILKWIGEQEHDNAS